MPQVIVLGSLFALAAVGASAMDVRVAPAEIVTIKGERLRLSPEAPRSWGHGTKLKHLQHLRPGIGVPAHGAIDPDSVIVRFRGKVLERGKDYLLDPVWGSLGIGPNSCVTTRNFVTVDYRYSLMRLDSLVETPDGERVVRQGQSRLLAPEPPALKPGEKRIANIFVNYFCDGTNADVFPILETAAQAKTDTTPGRIPRTLAKLKAGEPVTIVCWGDSVTAGGDASAPDKRYVRVFERRLKKKFPRAKITVKNVSVGGSNSSQWLYPERYDASKNPRLRLCRWDRVVKAKPDLVTLEFVNDAWLSTPKRFDPVYNEILKRVRALGAELLLITPHFTMPGMMGFKGLREKEKRGYVANLKRFAREHWLALADASSRWGHLWKEGLPYVTLLRNGINHPDDRGHAIFADEMMKCFEE